MDTVRFTIVFDQLPSPKEHERENHDAYAIRAFAALIRAEVDEIAELRRLSAELAGEEVPTYATT